MVAAHALAPPLRSSLSFILVLVLLECALLIGATAADIEHSSPSDASVDPTTAFVVRDNALDDPRALPAASRAVTIAFFYAPWCAFSQSFMPTFDALVHHFHARGGGDPRVAFARLNGDDAAVAPLLAAHHVASFPTVLILAAGRRAASRCHSNDSS